MKYTNLMQLWLRRTVLGEYQLFSWPVLVIVGLIPCGLLVTSNASFAEIPHTAEIVKVVSFGEGPRVGLGIEGESHPAKSGMRLQQFSDRLEIPPDNSSWAKLNFLSNTVKALTLIQAGTDTTPSVYRFPCHVQNGRWTMGWSKESNGACAQGIRAQLGSKSNQISQNSIPLVSLSSLWQSSLVSDNGAWQMAQSSNQQAWYCSAIAGDAWGVAASPFSPDEACRNALEKCNQGSTDGNCTLASEGEWNIDETNLRVSSRCAGNPVSVRSRPGTGMNMLGEVLPFMEKDTHFLHEKACIFDVFSPDSLVVAPSRTTDSGKASTEPILIQIHQVQDDLAVDVLTGWVDVVSEGRPNGLHMEKGNGYRLKQNSLKNLTESGCKEIYNSPPMKIFFNRESWKNQDDEVNQDVASRLTEYQNDFCYDVGKNENPEQKEPDGDIKIIIGPGHQKGGTGKKNTTNDSQCPKTGLGTAYGCNPNKSGGDAGGDTTNDGGTTNNGGGTTPAPPPPTTPPPPPPPIIR